MDVVRGIANDEHSVVDDRTRAPRQLERPPRNGGPIAGVLGKCAVRKVLEQAVMRQLRTRAAPCVAGQQVRADVCTRFCSDLAPCPDPYICTEFGSGSLCMPPPPVPVPKKSTYGCGCAAGGDAPGLAAGLFLAALVIAGRRRRGT